MAHTHSLRDLDRKREGKEEKIRQISYVCKICQWLYERLVFVRAVAFQACQ